MFSRLNDLDLGLQEVSINVQDKINNAEKLLEIKVKAGDVSAFPALESLLSEYELTLDEGVRDNMVEHLVSLRQQFRQYFPVMTEANSWMRSPFSVEASGLPKHLTAAEQENIKGLCSRRQEQPSH
ncbi:hypothetical protein KUCAC02_006239 [Chaenocephalus aceratus]|nr:hypothetical protein KUCAC02_006239 [Chaenocephalus aceratus]